MVQLAVTLLQVPMQAVVQWCCQCVCWLCDESCSTSVALIDRHFQPRQTALLPLVRKQRCQGNTIVLCNRWLTDWFPISLCSEQTTIIVCLWLIVSDLRPRSSLVLLKVRERGKVAVHRVKGLLGAQRLSAYRK